MKPKNLLLLLGLVYVAMCAASPYVDAWIIKHRPRR